MNLTEIAQIVKGMELMINNLKNEIDMLYIALNDYETKLTSEGEKIK